MILSQITAPTTPVITLAEARAHLRVTNTAEDDLIEALVLAATGWLDGWSGVLGMALEEQTWEAVLDYFPRGCLRLPLGPVVSITSIKYLDDDEVEQTLDASEYTTDLDSKEARILPVDSWPSVGADMNNVRVRFVAGKGAPDTIRVVVKLLVGHWYENREAAGPTMANLPMAVDMLIAPLRRVGV